MKGQCVESGKEYAEVMADDTRRLKLATSLKPEWYEVIDSISGNARSRKQSNLAARKSKNGGEGDGRVSAGMARTEAGPHTLLLEGGPALGTGSILAAPGRCRMHKLSEAVQRFRSLGPRLRSTLLDLILCEGRGQEFFNFDFYGSLSHTSERLSAVQSRSRSDVYDNVSMLMQMRLVHVCNGENEDIVEVVGIKWSRFHVLKKFVKKLIEKNHVLDTHRFLHCLDHKMFFSRSESLTLNRIRVLTFCSCMVESIDLRGLQKVQSLTIYDCVKLKEITRWKYLRELGWLQVIWCKAYTEYPDLRDLPSVRVFILHRSLDSVDPARHKFDISQCVRLCRLEISDDKTLKESGDLSSLKCLKELMFDCCSALSTVYGLSRLHSLTRLVLHSCKALRNLPDIGHMKELVHINIRCTSVEEIPDIEKLVSLQTFYCYHSKLKHLPDLHNLPKLRGIFLGGTPLIEDDPSSFYFDKVQVFYISEENSVLVDISDFSDTESLDDEVEHLE